MLNLGRVEISTLKQSFSIKIASFSPLNFSKFTKNSFLGPPNSLQLSIQTTFALLPYIAEQTLLPFHVPISKYRTSSVFNKLL